MCGFWPIINCTFLFNDWAIGTNHTLYANEILAWTSLKRGQSTEFRPRFSRGYRTWSWAAVKKCGLRSTRPIVALITQPKAKWGLGRIFLSYGRVLKTRPQSLFFVVDQRLPLLFYFYYYYYYFFFMYQEKKKCQMFTLWSTNEVKDPVHKNAHRDLGLA